MSRSFKPLSHSPSLAAFRRNSTHMSKMIMPIYVGRKIVLVFVLILIVRLISKLYCNLPETDR